MTTAEKLSKIQIEFKAKKSRFNSFGKYDINSTSYHSKINLNTPKILD